MTVHEMSQEERACWFALRQGEANARPLATIATETGLSRRAAEAAIEALRADAHEAICAGSRGYWEAATVAELDAYIRAFEGRCRSMWATRRGLKAARRRMLEEQTGQRTMGLVA
jgi:biotin operon repressor